MELAQLYAKHIAHVQGTFEKAMDDLKEESRKIEAVLIYSGTEGVYFADDEHIAFRTFGHFRWWLPVDRPEQMILVQPGQKPTYFQVVRPDFWYEQTVVNEDWWISQFNLVPLEAPEEVFQHLPPIRSMAFLGDDTDFAGKLGVPSDLQNEVNLTNYLDFYRGMKTEYEVEMIREANRMAMKGHQAAFEAFQNNGSEFDIHQAFLNANQLLEHDTPYTNIVGLDEKAAILHYQYKRRNVGADAQVLLIDAGCRYRGYCSDITRTYARDTTHPVFLKMIEQMDQLTLDLAAKSKVGTPYFEIHQAAHDGVLDILIDQNIVHGDREALREAKISSLFFPHGIGHLLGLQVHDVGGFFSDDHGKKAPPPEDHRFLRLNRKMEAGMVFTIEPGLYFIPVLLNPERDTDRGKFINWELVDALTPLGGIRVEDNIVVTEEGGVNLTR